MISKVDETGYFIDEKTAQIIKYYLDDYRDILRSRLKDEIDDGDKDELEHDIVEINKILFDIKSDDDYKKGEKHESIKLLAKKLNITENKMKFLILFDPDYYKYKDLIPQVEIDALISCDLISDFQCLEIVDLDPVHYVITIMFRDEKIRLRVASIRDFNISGLITAYELTYSYEIKEQIIRIINDYFRNK